MSSLSQQELLSKAILRSGNTWVRNCRTIKSVQQHESRGLVLNPFTRPRKERHLKGLLLDLGCQDLYSAIYIFSHCYYFHQAVIIIRYSFSVVKIE